jgi:Tfp pilus assembly protein PilP
MADKISPEEKLFNIIKEGKGSGSGGGVSRPKNQSTVPSFISWFLGHLKLHLGANKPSIDPKAVNKVLIAVLALVGVIFVLYIGRPRQNTSKIEAKIPKARPAEKSPVEPFKPLDTYVAAVKQRDIFKAVPKEEVKGAPTSREAQAKLKEIARDLKLVGISWGEDPKALVRSEKDKDTFFARKGQDIGTTEAKIKEITKNKVTIGYQDEEMELQ